MASVSIPGDTGRLQLFGVNLAGASFGAPSMPSVLGTSHMYPTHESIDYFASKGMDIVRLDAKWERLQPTLGGALDEAEIRHIDDTVAYAETKGVAVVVSLHNYAAYGPDLIGSAAVPVAAFEDMWSRLATRYADNTNVIFGLMNEPNRHSAAEWLPVANAGISAIRGTGATQQILVPGTYYSGADNWVRSDNDTVVGAGVRDPLGNFAFEVHQYLDIDHSGTHPDVVSETIGVERLQSVTAWARETGNRLFLGEFGVASDPTSLAALDGMLVYMKENSDVWQGGTYWAAGEWWGDYMYSVQPEDGADKPQMAVLEKYVSPQGTPYWHAEAPTPQLPTPEIPAPDAIVSGSGPDTLALRVSQDAYGDDAQFTVMVDGQGVGGMHTVGASRSLGESERFIFRGNWAIGPHEVGVAFLNDTAPPSPFTRHLAIFP